MKYYLRVVTVAVLLLGLTTAVGLAQEYADYWEQVHQEVFDGKTFDFEGATIYWGRAGTGGYRPWLPLPGRIEEAMELFNIGAFERPPEVGRDWDVNMARLLAGDSQYDYWFGGDNPGTWSAIAGGMLYPVSDIVPDRHWELLPILARESAESYAYQGKKWSVGAYGQGDCGLRFQLTIYNMTMLDREGQPDVYELWKDDLWTWAAAENIALDLTRDTTGDGEIDQWGMHPVNPVSLAIANDAKMVETDEQGYYVFALNSPQAIEGFNQAHQWNNVLNITRGVTQRPLLQGDVGLGIAQGGNHLGPGKLTELMEDEYGLAPLPKGPQATDYVFPATSESNYFIPVNAAQPEAMVALMSFLYRYDLYSDMEEWAAENAHNRQGMEVLIEAMTNWDTSVGFVKNGILGGIIGEATSAVFAGETTAAAALAEIEPAAQSALDEVFR